MEQRKIVIIIAIVVGVLVLALAGLWVYSLVNQNFSISKIIGNSNNQPTKETLATVEEANKQIENNYPDIITGTISFQSNNKAVLKTTDGKSYTFTPDQPKGIYGSFGVKEGSKINVKGKVLSNNLLQWYTIEVVTK